MTPEEALDLAKFQRPGIKLVVGATDAREEWLPPISDWRLSQLPGDWSWWMRELRLRLGYIPSYWSVRFAMAAKVFAGHDATDEEWLWLNGQASLVQARQWCLDLAQNAAPNDLNEMREVIK